MAEIAVIGMSCRFPGEADSLGGLWDMLAKGKTAYSEFPTDRINIDGFYHPDGHREGSISFKGGYFLRGDTASFDAPFFSVTEHEAKAMDPQQRILLETSYEAIESAGLRFDDLKGSDTSVIVGAFVRDYEQISLRDMDYQPQYAATGTGTAILSNRISYFYDLRGASMTVDTGCSGSLVAIHLACQELLSGSSTMAFAAGAGLILTPNTMMPMTALNFLSPDGQCFTFDSRANGYGRGEGVGFVILKRLSDALKDNDPIRAVIRATNLGQDGRTPGITMPSRDAQSSNIRKVYEKAGLDFDQTAYVECHGTGTKAGDVTELGAIGETLAQNRKPDQPVLVGSVKSNIGHLEGAAGVAGFIKGALIVEKGMIPPNANFQHGNPDIDFENWHVKVPINLTSWPTSGIRRVSVNCFGFGGTNAHAILDEGQYHKDRYRLASISSVPPSPEPDVATTEDKQMLFCFSSPTEAGLLRVAAAYAKHLRQQVSKEQVSWKSLTDLSYTLNCRRTAFERRLCLVASTHEMLAQSLEAVGNQTLSRSRGNTASNVAFIFAGQGAQWAAMGQSLLRFAPFRESLQAASKYINGTLRSDMKLMDELMKERDAGSQIDQPYLSQPATTAIQVALVDLFFACGIYPTAVVGHSSGEIAAAYAASRISREAAWSISFFRGACAAAVPDYHLEGAMCAVGMSSLAADEYMLKRMKAGHECNVEVACVNSHSSVTLSGDRSDIIALAEDLKQQGIFVRVLKTGLAYHSYQMEMVRGRYLQCLRQMPDSLNKTSSTHVEMYSTVTGELIEGDITAEYWVDNMVSRVEFSDAIQTMVLSSRPDVLVELSPHATLRSPIQDTLDNPKLAPRIKSCAYASAMLRESDCVNTLLTAASTVWARGGPIDMKAVGHLLNPVARPTTLSDLPLYPWDHLTQYWHESPLTMAYRFRQFGRRDLIGAPALDTLPDEPRWRGMLRISENPWLKDHQVQKTIIYPAAGIIAMAIEGMHQVVAGKPGLLGYEVTDMNIEKPMLIPEDAYGLEVSLSMKAATSVPAQQQLHKATFAWAVYGRMLKGTWTRHSHGSISAQFDKACHSLNEPDKHQATFNQTVAASHAIATSDSFYESLDAVGINYGPLFKNVVSVNTGNDQCWGVLKIPDTKSVMPHCFEFDHVVHPTTLDAAIHMLLAIDKQPMLPTTIDSCFVSASPAPSSPSCQKLKGYGIVDHRNSLEVKASVAMTSTDWQSPAISIQGLTLTPLPASDYLSNNHNLCSKVIWKKDYTATNVQNFAELVELVAHKYPDLSIMQVGGDAGLAIHTLNIVASQGREALPLARYSLSSPARGTFSRLKEKYAKSDMRHYVEERELDEDDTLNPRYNLIICLDPAADFDHLKRLLLPDGVLLRESAHLECAGDESDSACCFCDDSVHRVLVTYESDPYPITLSFSATFPALMAPSCSRKAPKPLVVILYSEKQSNATIELAEDLEMEIPQTRFTVRVASLEELSSSGLSTSGKTSVISLLDMDPEYHYMCHWDEGEFGSFKLIYEKAYAMLWVFRGANMNCEHPEKAMAVGLARSLASENEGKKLVTLDVSAEGALLPRLVPIITYILQRFLGAESHEHELSEFDGNIYIPRLVPYTTLNSLIEVGPDKVCETRTFLANKCEATTLTIDEHGRDHTWAVDDQPIRCKEDEVEIEFRAATIDQQSVPALGHSKPRSVAHDMMGVVIKVGSKVYQELDRLSPAVQIGDEVVAIVPGDSIKRRHCVNHRFVKRVPGGLSTCIPSVFIAVYYAFKARCSVGKKHRVLVGSGASSTGIAAIQIARYLGAEVYTTVSGGAYEEQKQYLITHLNMDDTQIFNCNEKNWAAAVLKQNDGKPIDIVLNVNQLPPADSGLIKKIGTIIQIPAQGPSSGTAVCHAVSQSVIRIDFTELLREEPDFIAGLFSEVWKICLLHLSWKTTPMESFDLSNLSGAFSHLESHVGEAPVLVRADHETLIQVPQEVVSSDEVISPTGTYILAGGLGGLGRSIARFLVGKGAKRLIFLSRSSPACEDAVKFLGMISNHGVEAKHVVVDVCDAVALQDAYAQEIYHPDHPVAGVVQAAAVLSDSLFDKMTFSQWRSVTNVKVQGSLNLVDIFSCPEYKPWFIFLSSSAGVIGNRGQTNYAAGNVFMDALAQSGRIPGHAVSVDIGPVLEVGMAADDYIMMQKLKQTGFYGIRLSDFLTVIERAIVGEVLPGQKVPTQIIMGIGTGGLIRQNQPKDPFWARSVMYSYLNKVDMPPPLDLSILNNAVIGNSTSLKAALEKLPLCDQAISLVCDALKVRMADKLAGVEATDIDSGRSLHSYGIDSLMAVQVRAWALTEAGTPISIFQILKEDLSIWELSRIIVNERKK